MRSARGIERRCSDDVAFRVITANQVPDHATIAKFRARHERSISELFSGVLALCARAGLVKVGIVAIDGEPEPMSIHPRALLHALVALATVGLASSARAATAGARTASPKLTIVLVHGAFADSGPKILVGHSYGGAVITQAASGESITASPGSR